MAPVYDYIVHLRVTRPGGQVEEYRHPLQAYGAMEAATCALLELDTEHGISKDGATAQVVSIRPDVEKVGAETRELFARAAAEAARALRGIDERGQ